ncbi:HPr family phosphocarrier protein [Oribacterium sp. oral taxon 102]|uniref:HPr family phosphocarrier protein n=1 Tax=Oribacterium sp. oral taxon 102 TaxID=671214 RepID=UPI0015BA144F|nr:HPr family phosphocarrier protein [Oribacterium sp. oral taxon 102]NWO21410.1 HPr family phosphocarrier protein [Oribacterium sp. oral taxon 102]
MREFNYTITDPNGIHARPAGLLVKQLKTFASSVTIFKGDKNVDMKKLLALMGLGVKQGDTVTIKVEGEDEEACAAALEKFLKETF